MTPRKSDEISHRPGPPGRNTLLLRPSSSFLHPEPPVNRKTVQAQLLLVTWESTHSPFLHRTSPQRNLTGIQPLRGILPRLSRTRTLLQYLPTNLKRWNWNPPSYRGLSTILLIQLRRIRPKLSPNNPPGRPRSPSKGLRSLLPPSPLLLALTTTRCRGKIQPGTQITVIARFRVSPPSLMMYPRTDRYDSWKTIFRQREFPHLPSSRSLLVNRRFSEQKYQHLASYARKISICG